MPVYRQDSLKNEYQKNLIEHKYKNIQSLLSELRVMDKSILFISGGLWTWILTKWDILSTRSIQNDEVMSYIYYIPFIITLFIVIKVGMLNREYYKERKKYYNLVGKILPKEMPEKLDYTWKTGNILNNFSTFNFTYYGVVVIVNLCLAIYITSM